MQYQVLVQGRVYKTLTEAPDSMALVWQVTNDKDAGKIPDYDYSKSADIKVIPVGV